MLHADSNARPGCSTSEKANALPNSLQYKTRTSALDRWRPFPDAHRKKNAAKSGVIGAGRGYGSALIAAHVAELLLGRHPLNHLRGIVTFGVQFERNPIVADGRLVGALGHDGLSEGIPCVGR